jgi:hypothetical protein
VKTSAEVAPPAPPLAPPVPPPAAVAAQIGRIEHPPIDESSGIIASRRHPGVFWTHNDSGNPPVLYAITRDGKLAGEFRVDAANMDWEDIAIDDAGHLYIGDIGNNWGWRDTVSVYRVDEPNPRAKSTAPLQVTESWMLAYPAAPFECEAMFVFGEWGYVISKVSAGEQASLYRFPLKPSRDPVRLERVAALPIREAVTGADISADGRRLAVATYNGLFVFAIGGDVASAGTVQPQMVRFKWSGVEACCFAPDGVMATSEGRGIYFFPNALVAPGQ